MIPAPCKLAVLALVCCSLAGCAVKRHWVSSEQAYVRWAVKMCEKTHPPEECTDPMWKPCGKDERCQP